MESNQYPELQIEEVEDGNLIPIDIHQHSFQPLSQLDEHKVLQIDEEGRIAVKITKLMLVSDDYIVSNNCHKFEWIMPDEDIVQADWLSEKTDKKGFLSIIETYCNPNDLLAVRLSFNNGIKDFKTPFYGCILTNQYSGDPELEDRSLQEL